MASRRIVPGSAQERLTDVAPSLPGEQMEKSNITPAVSKDVIFTLLAFTFAMVTLPLGTYFFTVNTIFRGNSTFAGGAAALMANVVLIGYVIVAMREDQADRDKEERKAKKAE